MDGKLYSRKKSGLPNDNADSFDESQSKPSPDTVIGEDEVETEADTQAIEATPPPEAVNLLAEDADSLDYGTQQITVFGAPPVLTQVVIGTGLAPALDVGAFMALPGVAPLANRSVTSLQTPDSQSNDTPTTSPGTTTPLSIVVQDGYLDGAEVWVDLNDNAVIDPLIDYKFGISINGVVNGSLSDAHRPYAFITTGGTDISTGLPFEGSYSATSGSTVVNPLTSLVQSMVRSSMGPIAGMSDAQKLARINVVKAEALAAVNSALGLPAGADLTSIDTISTAMASTDDAASGISLEQALEINSKALMVANMMAMGAAALQGASTSSGAVPSMSTFSKFIAQGIVDAINTASVSGEMVTLGDESSLTAILETASTAATTAAAQPGSSFAMDPTKLSAAKAAVATSVASTNSLIGTLTGDAIAANAISAGSAGGSLTQMLAAQKAVLSQLDELQDNNVSVLNTFTDAAAVFTESQKSENTTGLKLGTQAVAAPTVVADTLAATVTKVTVEPTKVGDLARFVVEMSEGLFVKFSGPEKPTIAIQNTAISTATAVFDRGASTGKKLVFTYKVQEGDTQLGIASGTTIVLPDTGFIRDLSANNANLSLDSGLTEFKAAEVIGRVGTSVNINSRTDGSISVVGESDLYSIQLTEGEKYVFTLEANSSELNAELNLFTARSASSESLLLTNDNAFYLNNNARITYIAQETGTYYIQANGVSETSGGYVLSVSDSDVPTPSRIAIPNPPEDSESPNPDIQWKYRSDRGTGAEFYLIVDAPKNNSEWTAENLPYWTALENRSLLVDVVSREEFGHNVDQDGLRSGEIFAWDGPTVQSHVMQDLSKNTDYVYVVPTGAITGVNGLTNDYYESTIYHTTNDADGPKVISGGVIMDVFSSDNFFPIDPSWANLKLDIASSSTYAAPLTLDNVPDLLWIQFDEKIRSSTGGWNQGWAAKHNDVFDGVYLKENGVSILEFDVNFDDVTHDPNQWGAPFRYATGLLNVRAIDSEVVGGLPWVDNSGLENGMWLNLHQAVSSWEGQYEYDDYVNNYKFKEGVIYTLVIDAPIEDIYFNVSDVSKPLFEFSFIINPTQPVVDTTGPTATHANGAYLAGTLSLTGTNFSTLLEAGENASTDIKARLDWTKLVWDINGDNGATANVVFVEGDIASAKVSNDTTLSIVLTTSKATALEATAGYAGITLDTLDITAGFARDAAGNAASTDAMANAPLFTQAGQSTIDLGSYGQLIAPVQVEGKWYYHWDRNDNGSSAGDYHNYNASLGFFPLSEIYNLFKQDINGEVGSSTNNTHRYATVNGIKLALPTLGAQFGDLYSRWWDGNYELLGTTLADPSQTNDQYGDLSAIWDAYNGTLVGQYTGQGLHGGNRGSGNVTSGAPAAWFNDTYISATPWGGGRSDYAALRIYDGLVFPYDIWGMNVAVEVVETTAPTLASTAPVAVASTIAGTAGNSLDETIALTLTFDGTVSGLTSGTDSTIFTVAGSGVSATWSGTGSTRTLTYTIAAGQNGQAAIDEAALKSALIAGIIGAAGNAFAYSGDISNIDASPLPVVDTRFDAAKDFIAGHTAQSANNIWQYFSADYSSSNITNLQLLSDWDTDGNGLIGLPQWDGNRTDGNYPFVQKQSNGDLIVHPDDTGKAVVVAWKNTTGSNVTVDLTGSLNLVGNELLSYAPSSPYGQQPSNDGITYLVTTSSTAYASGTPTVILSGALDENNSTAPPDNINLILSSQTLAPGAMISVAVHGNSNYFWDHTQLDLQITPRPATIDLGSYGQLIAPVQVEGKWYYYWDRDKDGSAFNGGSISDPGDWTSHDVLDGLFNQDINGVINTTVANLDGQFGTTDTYRYGTLNGVRVALPTLNGEGGVSSEVATGIGYLTPWSGTAYTDAGATSNGTVGQYEDFTAIWDAFNGTGTGTNVPGVPPGWPTSDGPWTATPGGSGHLVGALHSGGVWGGAADEYSEYYVALQVL